MSKTAHPYADDKPGAELPDDAPTGQVNDPSYKSSDSDAVPVVDDDAPVEDPVGGLGNADSDKQLGKCFFFCSHDLSVWETLLMFWPGSRERRKGGN